MRTDLDGAGSTAAARQAAVLATVEARLPAWRAHRPRRTLAAAWPTRPMWRHRRRFELADLPWVGVSWSDRGWRYRWRRVQAVVLLAVAVAVITCFDVGFAESAAETSRTALTWLVVVLAMLFAAGALLYLRSDLFGRRGVPGPTPLPRPFTTVGIVLGALGLMLTPGWLLMAWLDQLRRFPVLERAAWIVLADQQPPGWSGFAPRRRSADDPVRGP